jgi:geranylgeranyl diphosphate synthase, type III
MQSKSFCEDLTEGKFSFPIIHAINSRPGDTRLINILRQRPEEEAIKRYAIEWMIQCGSLSYTRSVLKGIRNDILSEIALHGGHPVLVHLIEKLDGQLDEDEKAFEMKIANRPADVVTTL